VARDDPVSVADLASGRGWTDVVVKPAVSVGAIGAHLGPADDPATQEALLAVLATGDALVQPYEPLVQTEGETSTIFIDGEPCHALRKVPAAGDYRSQPHLGGRATPVKPTAQQLALGRAALTAAERITGRRPLYARVDTVASSAGGHQLMELELIEPDLFWEHDTTAATAPRLAAALRSRLR
jgi:glutathione synthase/RimK-type ligase-like ATP-grasp enzyme